MERCLFFPKPLPEALAFWKGPSWNLASLTRASPSTEALCAYLGLPVNFLAHAPTCTEHLLDPGARGAERGRPTQFLFLKQLEASHTILSPPQTRPPTFLPIFLNLLLLASYFSGKPSPTLHSESSPCFTGAMLSHALLLWSTYHGL